MLKRKKDQHPNSNVQKICYLAKNRTQANECELNKLIESGVYINSLQGIYPAVALLAREKNIEAALYLVNKFDASLRWFILGLGTAGHVDAAQQTIESMPDKWPNLRHCLMLGLAEGGFIDVVQEQFCSADFYNNSQDLVMALGVSGSIEFAKKVISLVETDAGKLGDHYKGLLYGLGKGGHIDIAKKELSFLKYSHDDKQVLWEHFIEGLGAGGWAASAKTLIEEAEQDGYKNLNQEFLTGFSRGGWIDNINEELNFNMSTQDQSQKFRSLIAGFTKGGHYDAVNKTLNIAKVKSTDDELYFLRHLVLSNLPDLSKRDFSLLFLSLEDNVLKSLLIHYANNPSINKLAREATKLAAIKQNYQLDHSKQAAALFSQKAGSYGWLLKESLFFKKRYADGAAVENNLPVLPLEVFRLISSFVLGLSEYDTKNIIDAVNKKIFDGVNATIRNNYNLGLFSQGEYDIKKADADKRYQNRCNP